MAFNGNDTGTPMASAQVRYSVERSYSRMVRRDGTNTDLGNGNRIADTDPPGMAVLPIVRAIEIAERAAFAAGYLAAVNSMRAVLQLPLSHGRE